MCIRDRDYAVSTAHLTNDEDLALRRLLELYYLNEKPLTDAMQVLCRRVRVNESAVLSVLTEFFQLIDGKWYHSRCEEEIAQANAITARKSNAAQKRWNAGAMQKSIPAKRKQCTSNAAASTQHPAPKDTPIVPKGTDSEDSGESIALIRARSLMRMRGSTPLDSSQDRSWKKNRAAVEATSEEEWEILQWYYDQPGEIAKYRRKDLAQLLNNFSGEVQRARDAYQKSGRKIQKRAAQPPEPDNWRGKLMELYPDNFPDCVSSGNFPPTFRSLPDAVQLQILGKEPQQDAA